MALLYCCWSIFHPSALYWYSSLVLHILIGELTDCLLSVLAINYYNKIPKIINLKRIYLGSQFERLFRSMVGVLWPVPIGPVVRILVPTINKGNLWWLRSKGGTKVPKLPLKACPQYLQFLPFYRIFYQPPIAPLAEDKIFNIWVFWRHSKSKLWLLSRCLLMPPACHLRIIQIWSGPSALLIYLHQFPYSPLPSAFLPAYPPPPGHRHQNTQIQTQTERQTNRKTEPCQHTHTCTQFLTNN